MRVLNAIQKMKKLTRLLSLASIMMPMTLSAQEEYTWDFESEDQLEEWTIVDKDGDGYSWIYFNNEGSSIMVTHGGEGLMYSASYDNDNGKELTPDNWLISPEVTLDGVLSLWARGQDASYCEEVFGIFVCVGNSTDPDNFVQVGSDITATGEMTKYSFDLSTYAGQTGRFAIRHYQTTDMFILNIDDVCLNPNEIYIPPLPDPTLPTNITVTPAATTATVTWDGAEGDSWNIRYKEYNPNAFLWDFTYDNYKSQLEGWDAEDKDGDGYSWGLTYEGYDPTGQTANDVNVRFYSYSWDNSGVLYPDNWLYTPELILGGTFKFYAMNDQYPDVLGVYVVTEDGEYQIREDFAPSANHWTEYTFDTSAYNGKVGKIAIVHHNCHDQYRVYVDYISYEPAGYVQMEIDGLTEPSFTIPGLKPGTEYVVEVQAYNDKGKTKWTPVTHFTTTNNAITTGIVNGQRDTVKVQSSKFFAEQSGRAERKVQSEEWYTIDGRKLNGKPTAKGVYIHNGKAVAYP